MCLSTQDNNVPDMVIVHPLKESVSFDLLHSSGSDPVLTLTAEPEVEKTEHQVNTEEKETA